MTAHGVIDRRSVLAACAVAAMGQRARAALPLPVPRGNSLAFRLIRHGEPIGTHALAFRGDGDSLEVEIVVDVLVKFGPIPFVRYTHYNRESWRGDRLVGLAAHTDRNGRKLQMAAHWTGSALSVEGSGTKPYTAPENAFATTYWNKRMLLGPMIGTQDGMLVHPAVTERPSDPVRLASGAQIPVRRYQLSGDLDIELWYDESDTWAGMRFSADDGSLISYERM